MYTKITTNNFFIIRLSFCFLIATGYILNKLYSKRLYLSSKKETENENISGKAF